MPDHDDTSPPDARTADDVVDLVLGAPRHLTRDEVAAAAGTTVEHARALWRAMGFADVGDAAVFTEADVDGLAVVVDLERAGIIDERTAVDVVRAMGQTGARLADWQAGTFGRRLVEVGRVDPADGVRPDELALVHHDAEKLLPGLERLLVLAWRRHLAAASARAIAGVDAGAEAVDEGREPGVRLTVGFADLVGFTRLVRRLPPAELAALVESFESVSADVVALTGARLVKTLGDEVLFVAEHPRAALETAVRLHEANAHDEAVPELRIGLATGPVVSRMGDVFGTTVNLASRLTSMAPAGGTWCDRATADAARGAGAGLGSGRDVALDLRSVGPRSLRGVGLVWLYEVEGALAET